MFQFLRKPSACLRFVIAATASIGFSPRQAFAVDLDKMFDSLEPAYTTMAGAEECGLRLEIGPRLWRYAETRVRDLEARSGLSGLQLSVKRETAKVEGRQVAGIGACGSVQVAFQVLDELRKATGQPYPDDESSSTEARPSPRSPVLKKEPGVSSLVGEWTDAYIACRGGFGDEESTWAACGKRDEVAAELARRGYCEERSPDGSPDWTACAPSR
ncbi:hypothetical protein HFO24_05030 [Rhizobium laguerreae]|uniref:hypothetical protein n=1 Tax=Rhizobium laguerreae TaxID=1076926 RepID=UPI001C8FA89B|nr:hypothetical protein [Rhizobium laguerreae]MBY3181035.1 hypothetical protein [Rhizobium laguerreae]